MTRGLLLTITFPDLQVLASDLGIHVVEHRGGAKGWYSDSARAISLRAGLTPQQQLSTLAHEMGDARYRDTPSDGYYSARQERCADQYAAKLLVTPAEYALAETMYGPNVRAIAAELGVTPHVVETWRELHKCGKVAA
ncbi:ImmA/IrrE family metallo-endopeptidase [Corynebacterium sp. P6145]|uniref:ImmA/IrrE family metallo-endopeptidase n=1 Tax=Corynebacterium antarcticum TaxID=2800405 RepID=UPI0020058051|nr:ImmA/IrrE family metallo-endopeptidase [Corynebacterium antarcticum]MCK7641446.1 ImmA/IrrE family metallo-endopeptidase [Corynebacterium antarcticum]